MIMNAIYGLDTTINWVGVSRKFVWAMVIFGAFSLGAWTDSVFHGTANFPAIRAQAAKVPAAVAVANCQKERADQATEALLDVDPVQAARLPTCPPPPAIKSPSPLIN